jgi:hypothetical protein
MAAGRRIARTAVGDARRPSRAETSLLEIAVLPIRVPDRPVPRIRFGEDLATAVIVEPLSAPFVARSAICWCGAVLFGQCRLCSLAFDAVEPLLLQTKCSGRPPGLALKFD